VIAAYLAHQVREKLGGVHRLREPASFTVAPRRAVADGSR
jgi:hypothetical protein